MLTYFTTLQDQDWVRLTDMNDEQGPGQVQDSVTIDWQITYYHSHVIKKVFSQGSL